MRAAPSAGVSTGGGVRVFFVFALPSLYPPSPNSGDRQHSHARPATPPPSPATPYRRGGGRPTPALKACASPPKPLAHTLFVSLTRDGVPRWGHHRARASVGRGRGRGGRRGGGRDGKGGHRAENATTPACAGRVPLAGRPLQPPLISPPLARRPSHASRGGGQRGRQLPRRRLLPPPAGPRFFLLPLPPRRPPPWRLPAPGCPPPRTRQRVAGVSVRHVEGGPRALGGAGTGGGGRPASPLLPKTLTLPAILPLPPLQATRWPRPRTR